MPHSLILTAFEPFDGRKRNASAMVLDRVDDERIERRRLPVVFDALEREIAALLDARPRVLVLMGETSQSRGVRVERVALNVIDAGDRPDNCGKTPSVHPVRPAEPLARWATWDADAVLGALRARDIEATTSYHAGTYACNQSLYLALSMAAARALDIPIGFLHVPGRARAPVRTTTALANAIPAVFDALVKNGDAP